MADSFYLVRYGDVAFNRLWLGGHNGLMEGPMEAEKSSDLAKSRYSSFRGRTAILQCF